MLNTNAAIFVSPYKTSLRSFHDRGDSPAAAGPDYPQKEKGRASGQFGRPAKAKPKEKRKGNNEKNTIKHGLGSRCAICMGSGLGNDNHHDND
jgi:hypothetical protein